MNKKKIKENIESAINSFISLGKISTSKKKVKFIEGRNIKPMKKAILDIINKLTI